MTGGGAQENISSWLELESDPGLFTLLVDDFGVKGVQVEEIYDLSKTLENSIFGFIFLFKWMERRGRRKAASLDANSSYVTDPNIVNNMFFAHQVVPNSCATHALLSILLNCRESKYFDLGELLLKFQRLCTGLSPENKGIAIGHQQKLAEAHNSYAKPENQSSSRSNQINDSPYASSSTTASSSVYSYTNTSTSTNTMYSTSAYSKNASSNEIAGTNQEIFHFICFVPINGRLYELDGLKPYPVDHGSIDSESSENKNSNWTNKFKQIIKKRLSSFNSGQQSHEIRFNLMALVPDKMIQLGDQINLMKHNYSRLFDLVNELENASLNESDLNLKNELSDLNNIKMEPSINPSCSDTKPPTRQLRSTRSNQNINIKEEVISINCNKNEQFEVCFLSDSNSNDESKKNLAELCKLYQIESISNLATKKKNDAIIQAMDLITDRKEKENEIINKIKMQLSADNHALKSQFQNSKFKTDNDVNCRFKKYSDLSTIKSLEKRLFSEIETEEASYNEEREKRKKYRTDALRRKHIYDEFIVTYLKTLNENGKLAELIRNNGSMSTSNSTQINLNKSQNSPIFLQQLNGPTKKRKNK